MTATERLDAIEARVNAATEGPWRTYRHGYGLGIEGPVEDEQLIVETYGLTYPENPSDAEFIAHARQDVPALVAALRAVLDLTRHVGNDSTGPEFVACYEVQAVIESALDGPR